jgi:hypothetical protein
MLRSGKTGNSYRRGSYTEGCYNIPIGTLCAPKGCHNIQNGTLWVIGGCHIILCYAAYRLRFVGNMLYKKCIKRGLTYIKNTYKIKMEA